jgi:hypothetical protein
MTSTDSPRFHTVNGKWRSGDADPDWKVLTVQATGDPEFPWLVLVRYDALPGMTNPCQWKVPSLDCIRYDLSQAVAIPHLIHDQEAAK